MAAGTTTKLCMSLGTRRGVCQLMGAVKTHQQARHLCSYKSQSAFDLQKQDRQSSAEQSHYVEQDVRNTLKQYQGGAIHLNKDESTGIATITIDNPKVKNAFTGEMMLTLCDHVNELSQWHNGRVVRVTGADNEFCTGGDLKFMQSISDPVMGAKMSIFMQTVLSRLHQLPMISVAQVSGHALGGGAELACATDLRVLHKDAKLGFVQAKLGIVTGWGGGVHLRKHVSRSWALRILAGARVMKAQECKTIGLADEVVDSVEAMNAFTDNLTANCPETVAIRAVKRLIRNSDAAGSSARLDRERLIFTELWGGPAHARQLAKIMEKLNK